MFLTLPLCILGRNVYRYLCGTENYGLLFRRDVTTKCAAYPHADSAGDEDTRRSTTGTIVMMAGAALMWRSRLQKLVTLSTCEAELVALCETMKDAMWILELLKNIGMNPEGAFVIHEDNAAALIVAETGRRKARTKHFDVRYFGSPTRSRTRLSVYYHALRRTC